MKRLLLLVTVVALSLVTSGLLLAESDAFVGTWKLNVVKSKYVGVDPPKSQTRTVEAQGKGEKFTFEGVAADGSKVSYSFTTNRDGKDVPVSGMGQPSGADVIAARTVNPTKIYSEYKKAGKAVRRNITVVSKDGQTTTVATTGTNEQGRPTSTTQIYEKQ